MDDEVSRAYIKNLQQQVNWPLAHFPELKSILPKRGREINRNHGTVRCGELKSTAPVRRRPENPRSATNHQIGDWGTREVNVIEHIPGGSTVH